MGMNIKKSNFAEDDGILIVNIGGDINEEFLNSIFERDTSKVHLAIIATDNSFKDALEYTTKAIEELKKSNICIISIFKDLTEDDEDGNKTEPPIELQLWDLKEKVNTLVIAQKGHTYQEVIGMILSFFEEVPDMQAELLAHKFEHGGFSYYNSKYRPDAWNSEALMDYAIFDSMFTCPLYMAGEVFCKIEGGSEFKMTENNDLGDQGIMLSYLEDYLAPGVLLNSAINQDKELLPFAINVQLLFSKFGDECFDFDENGSSHYPESPDKRLRKRIDRMLQMPFHNNKKRKLYEKSFDDIE